ncbi:glycosyl transferase family 2 [Suttonella ornithocola]|uniref:Lipid A biosynthesis lauroyl acyltransferase n=1 Tax=Suttonella ornithocola TaxID=279832 RepID=A0A380MRZ8_9GAMM|nr:glycosyl transferase family 2 [Suttonella ornithocola]SUO95419.1 lipid A biosynthesis lauroyl acyltransferase [Suttonella ornithocola]
MEKINPQHWAKQSERGNRWILAITIWIVRYLPSWLIRLIITLVAFYYFLTSPSARCYVSYYQRRLRRAYGEQCLPKYFPRLRQFMAFAESIADRFAVWQHRLTLDDIVIHRPQFLEEESLRPTAGSRGQLVLCSHLGNIEITRAFAARYPHFKLNVLIHSGHAKAFNAALKKAGADDLRLLQVTELNPATMMMLAERVDAGEWIAIAADRVPVRGEKILAADFLGDSADFAQGPWLLAGLLKTPINTLFCLKEQGRYHIYFERFMDELQWQHSTRMAAIQSALNGYSKMLENYCRKAPLQWFNFFNFWQDKHD